MTPLDSDPDFDAHEKELRRGYVRAPSHLRLQALREWESEGEDGNQIRAYLRLAMKVSATEALARSLVLDAVLLAEELGPWEAYSRYKIQGNGKKSTIRSANAATLVDYLIQELRMEPAEQILGENVWKRFCFAQRYRNLILHEGTFLRGGYAEILMNATEEVYGQLVEIAERR